MPAQKIATCCYCGTRAALVLQGKTRHELACSNCGAPLHDLKILPREKVETRAPSSQKARFETKHERAKQKYAKPKKRKKSGKSFMKKAFSEVFDVLEDIFD